MRVKMKNGVILESDNEAVNEMRLKHGGVEAKNRKGSRRTATKTTDTGKEK